MMKLFWFSKKKEMEKKINVFDTSAASDVIIFENNKTFKSIRFGKKSVIHFD